MIDESLVGALRGLARAIVERRAELIAGWQGTTAPPILKGAVVPLLAWGAGEMLTAEDAEIVIQAGQDDEYAFGKDGLNPPLAALGTATALVGRAAYRVANDQVDHVSEQLTRATQLLQTVKVLPTPRAGQ